MTSFSTRAFLIWALSAGLACAQGQAPRATAPAFDDAAPQQAEVAVTPEGVIEESPIAVPSIEGYGALDAAHGGLPPDIWAGSRREAIDPLLALAHGGIGEDAVARLVTRLLMTEAAPPRGGAAPNAEVQGWFSARAQALIDLGQDDKATELLASLPRSMSGAALREMQAELMLVRGEYGNACKQDAPSAAEGQAGGNFWRRLRILCLSRAGKQEEAMLGLDLMREESRGNDAFFQEAVRRIGDKTVAIRSNPAEWTPLDVAALRLAADTDKIRDRLEAFPPVAVKYLAADKSLDAKLHEKAQARAAQLALLPPAEGNKPLEQPFSRPLASDVTTLVTALGSGQPANDADNAVIARLALGDSGLQDSRRVARLLTLMEPFGYRVPPETWRRLYRRPERFDGEVPPASLLARLEDAAQAHRRGEAVLLAGLILGNGSPARQSDLVLLPVIRALQKSGFADAARGLAYDAVKDYRVR